MSVFFRLFQHLLPLSRLWNIIYSDYLRKWFAGLVPFQSDYKLFVDKVFEDSFPETTRILKNWEAGFSLKSSGPEADRRKSLAAAWSAQGGQSPGYLQRILQTAGFDVFVHEWWEYQGPVRVVRDPRVVLGIDVQTSSAVFGEPEAVFGEPEAVFGAQSEQRGYVLVNKSPGEAYFKPTAAACFGEPEAVCGEPESVFGEIAGVKFVPETYKIPSDPAAWRYFIYVGAEIFPTQADVLLERQEEFEQKILKYFPAQFWVGLLINYI